MGLGEVLIITFIILIVFGSNRLPGIARGFGHGIRNFKEAIKKDPPPKEP